MTKIKQFQCIVPDEDGTRQQKTVHVHYDSKGDRFYVNLPEYMDSSVGQASTSSVGYKKAELVPTRGDGRLYGPTPGAVEKLFERRCFDYAENVRRARRVILYTLKYAKKHSGEHHDMPFEHGTGIAIEFEVMWETKLGTEKPRYSTHNPCDPKNRGLVTNRGPRQDDSRCKVIDWTQDREDFFVALDTKLQTMVDRSRSFLEDDKKLALLIDSGSGLKALGFEGKK